MMLRPIPSAETREKKSKNKKIKYENKIIYKLHCTQSLYQIG